MIALGPLTIYSQGIFLLIAAAVSSYLFWREGTKAKFSEEELFDFILLTLVGGLVGGRFLYFLLQKERTLSNFFKVFVLWEAGGTFWFGALLAGFLVGSLFAKKRHWSLLKIWDLAVPPILLAQALITLPTHLLGALIIGLGSLGGWYLSSLKLGDGLLLVYYLFFVSLTKFAGEYFNVKKIYFWGLNVNLLFAVLLFLAAVILSRRIFATADMKKIRFKPKEALSQIKALLSREEKEIHAQEQRLKAGDPLFEPGRTQSNPELVAEAEEEIGHRRVEAAAAVLKGRLSQVKRALARVKRGKYGVCEVCGQAIDSARLKVDPSVTLCIDCQERKEQQTPQGGA